MNEQTVILAREAEMLLRRLGHAEFRIAAMRLFKKLNMPAQAVAMSLMDVDDFLTPEELANRNKTP
jgi:hypothetical protein